MLHPIPPGSAVDAAINAVVDQQTNHTPIDIDVVVQVDLHNPAHMQALGTRLWLRHLAGLTEPSTLVGELHARWYGAVGEQV